MIKVPGTPEGLPAVEELLSRGININVTLLFSVVVYEQWRGATSVGLSDCRERRRCRTDGFSRQLFRKPD